MCSGFRQPGMPPAPPAGSSAASRSAGLPRDVPHGSDPGPRRRGNRRSYRSRSSASAGGRSRVRFRHSPMRLLLSMPARARRYVPVSGPPGPQAIWFPIAEMRDGTPVYANSHIGGLAELMVTFEEWVVPVFTKASAVDLGMVCSCVSVAGLGCTASQVLAAIEAGSVVAVVGCGPLGLAPFRARALPALPQSLRSIPFAFAGRLR